MYLMRANCLWCWMNTSALQLEAGPFLIPELMRVYTEMSRCICCLDSGVPFLKTHMISFADDNSEEWAYDIHWWVLKLPMWISWNYLSRQSGASLTRTSACHNFSATFTSPNWWGWTDMGGCNCWSKLWCSTFFRFPWILDANENYVLWPLLPLMTFFTTKCYTVWRDDFTHSGHKVNTCTTQIYIWASTCECCYPKMSLWHLKVSLQWLTVHFPSTL